MGVSRRTEKIAPEGAEGPPVEAGKELGLVAQSCIALEVFLPEFGVDVSPSLHQVDGDEGDGRTTASGPEF